MPLCSVLYSFKFIFSRLSGATTHTHAAPPPAHARKRKRSKTQTEAYLYFCSAALAYLRAAGAAPQVLHVHEWQCCAAAMLFWDEYAAKAGMARTRVAFTIHNMDSTGECRQDEFAATGACDVRCGCGVGAGMGAGGACLPPLPTRQRSPCAKKKQTLSLHKA